jgi:N6-L-threonylcarbamoyladenine synthase
MLGLAYPGGPEIERSAEGGDPARFNLPRSMLHSGDANFSFSGLKTASAISCPSLHRTIGPTFAPLFSVRWWMCWSRKRLLSRRAPDGSS